MKRWIAILVVAACILQVSPASAKAKPAAVSARAPRRAVVVVNPGWPLQRPLRAATILPVRTTAQVKSATFLPVVAFNGAVVAPASGPTRDLITWEDGETLTKHEDWTEFTFGCGQNGRRLWLQIPNGRIQFDWVEVVFDNGDAQVIDFAERTHGPGIYSLFDGVRGRTVDHVRVVARARSDEAKVFLQLQKG